MSLVSIDVLRIISSYIEPNPKSFCQLAGVNRNFYSVFTSDKVWKNFNPYGRESDIYQHFQSSTSCLDLRLLRIIWSAAELEDYSFSNLLKLFENKYTLASICAGLPGNYELSWEMQCLREDRNFMSCVARLVPKTAYRLAHRDLQSDPDFYILCGHPRPGYNTFRGMTKETVLKILDSSPPAVPFGEFMDWLMLVPDHLARDSEVIKAAGLHNHYQIMSLDRQLARELLESSPELVRLSLEHHGADFVKAFKDLVTKELIMNTEHDDWNVMLEVVDRDWHLDPDFVAAVLKNGDPFTQMAIREDCKEDLGWMIKMSSKFSFPQYSEFMRHDPPIDLNTLYEAINMQGSTLALQEYFRSVYRLDEAASELLLSIWTEKEYIMRAIAAGIGLEPYSVSEEAMADRELALALVKFNPEFYFRLLPSHREDPEFFQILRSHTDPRNRLLKFDVAELPEKWLEYRHLRGFMRYAPSMTYLSKEIFANICSNLDPIEVIEVLQCNEGQRGVGYWKCIKPSIFRHKEIPHYIHNIARRWGIFAKDLFVDRLTLAYSIEKRPFTFKFAPKHFKSDIKLLCQLVVINPSVLSFFNHKTALQVLENEDLDNLSCDDAWRSIELADSLEKQKLESQGSKTNEAQVANTHH